MFVLKQYWGTRGGSFCIYSTGYFEQKLSVVASFIRKGHLMPWYIFSSALNNSFSKCWGKSPLSLLSQNLCLTHICLRIILGGFVYLGGWGCVYIEMVFFLFLTFTTIKSISRPWMSPCFWDAIVFSNLRNTSSEIEIFPEALMFEITQIICN